MAKNIPENTAEKNLTEEKPSAIILAVIGITGRLLPHLPNFAPIGGTALFSGSKLSRPLNYILPLGVMFITDIFLGFHKTMPFIYISFMLIVLLGELFLKNNPSHFKVSMNCLVGSTLFYAITNYGVWQVSGLYPHTAAGLITCYVMAIPFYKWTILGNLFYGNSFFALYNYAHNLKSVQQFDKTVGDLLNIKYINN